MSSGLTCAASKRDLVGRKIVDVDFRRSYDKDRAQWITHPVLTLDNGRRVWISTQETETGHGHTIHITEKGR